MLWEIEIQARGESRPFFGRWGVRGRNPRIERIELSCETSQLAVCFV